MNPFQSIIHLLSDPNIAFILLTIGFYGLIFELQSPNFVTGILGAIALILAFIGFGSLPLNVAGLLLIGLAILLFVLEFTVTSHGLLTVGGPGLLRAGRVRAVHGPGRARRPPTWRWRRRSSSSWRPRRPRSWLLVLVTVVRDTAAGPRLRGRLRGGWHDDRADRQRRVASGQALAPLGIVYAVGEEWSAQVQHAARRSPGRTRPRHRPGRAYAHRRAAGPSGRRASSEVTT